MLRAGFGANVSGSPTTTGVGSPSRPRPWAAGCWPRLRPLPHPLRCCAGTATSSQPSTMVLPPSSVGEMALRLYSALSYSQNSACDLPRALNGA